MSDWNEGYVTEIAYTHGYYRELSPSLQRFALIVAGFAPHEEGAYLELGCGQGLSACIHAAATPSEIWATDFNPNQTLNALDLLNSAGIEARLFDQSFAEFAARKDLPQFSHITAHGIWTWVSEESRQVLVDILSRQLSVGGAAYLSYNTLPGWGSALAMRHLMSLHAEINGSASQSMGTKVAEALAFTRHLADNQTMYFKLHPEVVERLERISAQDTHYIAHEYFNANWLPMHFADMAKRLSAAKLEFAASAHLLDHVAELNIPAQEIARVANTQHEVMRETLRDFYVNQFFRRDIYLRGRRKLSALEQYEKLDQMRFALLTPWEQIPLKLTGPLGEIGLQEIVYQPLVATLMEEACRPKRLSELRAKLPNMTMPQLLQAIMVLTGLGHVHPAQDEAVVTRVLERTKRLNRAICSRARYSDETQFLASPVIGAGIMVPRLEQLLLLARDKGKGSVEDWVRSTWDVLALQDYRLQKEGRRLETVEENLAELHLLANDFVGQRLQILQSLGVA